MFTYPAGFHQSDSAPSTLLDGLLAWWDMDETGGTDTRVDSHNSFDLLHSSSNVVSRDGIAGKVAGIDTNAILKTASNPGLGLASMTMAGFVRKTALTSDSILWGQITNFNSRLNWNWVVIVNGTSGSKKASFRISDGTNQYIVTDTVNFPSGAATPFDADHWGFVVASYDGAEMSLTVDNGTPVTLSVVTTLGGDEPLAFGSGHPSYGHDGDIGTSALWNRKITADEIAEFYNSKSGLFYDDLA